MKKIGLVIEEPADLPKEIIEKYQMAFVPYMIDWPEGEDLVGENIFQKMREAEKKGIKTFIETSQPSPKKFLDAYKSQFQKFEKVVCITVSSKVSGGYNSAIQGRNFLLPEEKERVFIVDSFNASGGEGLLVLKAVDLIKKNKNIEEIVEELNKFIPRVHLVGMLGDPKWLEYSGRLSHILANFIRRMTKIGVRPLVGLRRGKVTLVGVKKGAKDVPTALFRQLETETKKMREKAKRIRVAITHGDNFEGVQRLKEMIEKEIENVEILFLNLIDPVIGARVGPGTLICAWCEA